MNSPTKEEVKEKRQLCYRSVTALFAQVPEEVAHDVHANVTAYIDHLESELNSRPAEGQLPRCGVCGGDTVVIRGRFVNEDKRRVCPTCCAERLDYINEMSSRNYGIAYTSAPLKEKI